jgi:uncharacterized membrane protein
MDFEPIRWVTVHPALVHFPLGILPLAALAYVMAAARRSRPWTFAGDVALIAGSLAVAVAGVFGIVAWLVVQWPGGLDPWRWIHLGAGVSSVALALVAMIARLATIRRYPTVGAGWAAAAVGLSVLVLFTGWVGGEVLVFHGGMAVKAAGNGALAPASEHEEGPPENFLQAMHRLRGAYGSATATMASAIVEHPRDRDFTTFANDARTMQVAARWVAQHGAEGAPSAEQGEHVVSMARDFVRHAADLEQAAATRQLSAVADQLGVIQADCAACHEHTRWEGEPEREHAGEHVARSE